MLCSYGELFLDMLIVQLENVHIHDESMVARKWIWNGILWFKGCAPAVSVFRRQSVQGGDYDDL